MAHPPCIAITPYSSFWAIQCVHPIEFTGSRSRCGMGIMTPHVRAQNLKLAKPFSTQCDHFLSSPSAIHVAGRGLQEGKRWQVPLSGKAQGENDSRSHMVGLGCGLCPGEGEWPQDLVNALQAARQQAPAGGVLPSRLDSLRQYKPPFCGAVMHLAGSTRCAGNLY